MTNKNIVVLVDVEKAISEAFRIGFEAGVKYDKPKTLDGVYRIDEDKYKEIQEASKLVKVESFSQIKKAVEAHPEMSLGMMYKKKFPFEYKGWMVYKLRINGELK